MLALLASGPAAADNAALQSLFFAACEAPSGTLTTRCAETPGGLGNLSGDSESSLNPSQSLGTTSAAYAAARLRGDDGRARGERLRGDAPDDARGALDLGPFSLLISGHRLLEERDRTVDVDAERGYRADGWRAQLGADRRLGPGLVLGALLTWETSDLDYDRELPGVAFTPLGRAGSVDQDSFGGTVFASVQLGSSGYLDLSAGYLASDLIVRREAVFQESGRTTPQTLVSTRASTDGAEVWAAAALGFSAARGPWSFSPYVGTTVSRLEVDGYDERDLNDSGLAMSAGSLKSRSALGQAGVRVSRSVSRPGYVLLPQLKLEYLHEFRRDAADTRVAFLADLGGNTLRLQGDRREASHLDVGLGLVLLLPNGWMPYVEYQETFGDGDLDRRQIALGLRVEL